MRLLVGFQEHEIDSDKTALEVGESRVISTGPLSTAEMARLLRACVSTLSNCHVHEC